MVWVLKFIHLLFHFPFSETIENINVFIAEEKNVLAKKSFGIAMEYVKRNPDLGFAVDPVIVVGNQTAKTFLENVCKKYNDMLTEKHAPHVVLDFTTFGVRSDSIKTFTSALALPTVSGSFGQTGDLQQWKGLNSYQTQYLLQVMPPVDHLLEAVRSIIAQEDITKATIIYDEFFEMDHKYQSLLQNNPSLHVTRVDSFKDDAIIMQLQSLRDLGIANFFIIGSMKTITNVLNAANDNQYLNRTSAWFAITLDKGNKICNCKDATIVHMKPSPDAKSWDRLFKVISIYKMNAEPEITSAFYFDLSLRTFLAIKSLRDSGKWPNDMEYISCDEYDGKNTPTRMVDLKTAFQEIKETPTYAPFFIPECGSMTGRSYVDYEMDLTAVTIKNGILVNSISLGSWKAGLSNQSTLTNPKNISQYVAPLVYRVVTTVHEPFVMKDDRAPKGYTGYCIDLLEEMSKIMNFDYEIYLVPDGTFGSMDENGNWNGVTKELIDKRADIGVGPISVTLERKRVVDFTRPVYDSIGFSILMKSREPTSLFKFLTVQEHDVWFSILTAFFFTSFLMWVFDKWSPYSYRNSRKKHKEKNKRNFTLKECLWFCMTSLTPQGGGEAPKNVSGRLLAATWWLFSFIILTSYTANLAAFLTVSHLDASIKSLDDLSKQYKIKYAPFNRSNTMIYLKRMANIEAKFHEIWIEMSLNVSMSDIERAKFAVWNYPVGDKYTKMWAAMKKTGFPASKTDAVARVKASKSPSEGFAYLGDATYIRYHVMTNCDVQMVGNEFSKTPIAFAVQQGSPVKEQLDKAMHIINNKNTLEDLKEKWWNNNPNAVECNNDEDPMKGISIRNIGGIFTIIFMGIGLACITMGVEYWWYEWRKQPVLGNVTRVQPVMQNVGLITKQNKHLTNIGIDLKQRF